MLPRCICIFEKIRPFYLIENLYFVSVGGNSNSPTFFRNVLDSLKERRYFAGTAYISFVCIFRIIFAFCTALVNIPNRGIRTSFFSITPYYIDLEGLQKVFYEDKV